MSRSSKKPSFSHQPPPLDLALVERAPGETRVALLAQDEVWEIHHLRDHTLTPGDVVLGRVRGKAPGGAAVFVDIGAARDGFLAAEDCAPRDATGQPSPLPTEGSTVLVQVAIAPRAEKGAKVTMALSLTPQGCEDGSLLVYTPLRPGVGVSSKITHKAERQRLLSWAEEAGLGPQSHEGVVLRTRAYEAPERALNDALGAARQEWAALKRWASQAKPPCRLRAAIDSEGGALGVALNGRQVDRVICAGAGAWEAARAGRPDLIERIVRARSTGSLFAAEGVDEAIEQALSPIAGPLTIEQTAAVTAIDVDSGPATAEQTNHAMVREIARQIRLRNLAGMIVIDFAAPRSGAQAHKRHLAQELAALLASDPAQPTVLGVSAMGLVEVRRPRRGAPLADLLLGPQRARPQAASLSPQAAALAALRAAVGIGGHSPGFLPLLQVAPAVGDQLRGALRGALGEAEQRIGDRLPLEDVAGKGISWWDILDRRGRPVA